MIDMLTEESALAALLIAIRVGAALRFTPFLGGKPLPLLPWIAISIAIAFASAPQAGALQTAEPGGVAMFVLVAKELFIGVSLGAFVYIAFSIFEIVGELAYLSAMSVPEAQTGRGTPVGRFYALLGATAFLLIGGHHSLVTAFSLSVRCLPPTVVPDLGTVAGSGATGLIELFSATMAGAVMVAAPLFVAGLVAELTTGLADRLMPGVGHGMGAQAIRALAVQIALVATLGVTVSISIDFLNQAVTDLPVCATAR